MTAKQLQAIEKFVKDSMAKSLDVQHGFRHVDQVRKNALRMVKILKLEKEIDENLLEAACLLHDILYIKHKFSFLTWLRESKYLREMLPSILEKFDLSEGDRYLLSEAVYNHTLAFPFRRLNHKYSLYAQILQDADQIEFIDKTRLINLKESKKFSKFYKFISLFSGLFVKRIRKNMNKFINIPEIIEYFKEDIE
jgi:HD superfamily phosphohydrolase YqeK